MRNLTRILIPVEKKIPYEKSNRYAIQGVPSSFLWDVIQPESIQRNTTSNTLRKCLQLRSFLHNALKRKPTMKNSFDCASN